MLSTVPTLVEARLAAAAHGVELSFEPGRGNLGEGEGTQVIGQGTAFCLMHPMHWTRKSSLCPYLDGRWVDFHVLQRWWAARWRYDSVGRSWRFLQLEGWLSGAGFVWTRWTIAEHTKLLIPSQSRKGQPVLDELRYSSGQKARPVAPGRGRWACRSPDTRKSKEFVCVMRHSRYVRIVRKLIFQWVKCRL